ncbi:hypothetical protein LY78DRAFT_684954 [Colletotrichum sublineola]|nr:hypothetical protein LY78DRAFT_684954 [Colletotrichum sublineola]
MTPNLRLGSSLPLINADMSFVDKQLDLRRGGIDLGQQEKQIRDWCVFIKPKGNPEAKTKIILAMYNLSSTGQNKLKADNYIVY